MMKNKKGLSQVAIVLSAVAVILSAIVNITGATIWLAGTQWILVGIVLAVYAIYLESCSCTTGGDE